MKQIWAPWRKKYISRKSPRRCIFCLGKRAEDDRRNYVIMRSATCLAMLNAFPYNSGHIMIAPLRHVASLDDLTPRELAGLITLVRDSMALLKRRLSPEGFNVGMNLGTVAGAGVVGHLHIHIVPRWGGDTNFMPVMAGTKVIPHSLDDMYGILAARSKGRR